jgi:hypothetical protein
MKTYLIFLAILSGSLFAMAQSDVHPEILVLGTYHMANPGHDIYNMQADDVLAPKRQQEIAQLLEVLKKFNPTKIAIESDPNGPRPAKYADYLAGKYSLTSNEIDQIGFRLAKELGHQKIYPVDEDGDFPYQRVANYAKANGRAQQFEAIGAKIGEMVKQEDAFLHSHTVLEMLQYMNSDEQIRRSVGFYFADIPFSDPGDYAGPDLLAAWYQRNIRIYSNIIRIIDSPNDRILVIYGAGHLGWLQQDVANDPSVKLRKFSEFTSQK